MTMAAISMAAISMVACYGEAGDAGSWCERGHHVEMHQIRYFLAVSRTLNFTRAAEECHVAQPSLTRAIKLLEAELGGDLFRRERNLTHLTEFGQKMLPLMLQCFESALAAKKLASSIKSGTVASLTLGLSQAVSMALLVSPLTELMRVFPSLELRFVRGTASEISESLKKGEASLAIAGPLGEPWERLDAWPLFAEQLRMVVGSGHSLARAQTVGIADLRSERLLTRPYCELANTFSELARERDICWSAQHAVVCEADFIELAGADLGIGMLPQSTPCPEGLRRLRVDGLEIARTVYLYAVAGRERAAPATALMKLLRARDWSAHLR
jgi:DNA-binding transcriptional LysR family regulator